MLQNVPTSAIVGPKDKRPLVAYILHLMYFFFHSKFVVEHTNLSYIKLT